MRKFVIILTIILFSLVACKKEDFLWNLPRVDCNFVYSAWSSCNLDNMQTRTYTSSSSGCTPPADSIQRNCVNVILSSVVIGTQTWTTKNLDVETYRNGDVIPQVQDATAWSNLTSGAWCYYENNTAIGSNYGKLYNWYAVNDPRGLAPNGYLIPSDAEWTILTDYLGGEAVAGTKMKSNIGWNGNNSSGFAGLPGGYRKYDGGFNDIYANGYWWSSSESSPNVAWLRYLNYNDGSVLRSNGFKSYGFSVRCLREETSTCTFVYSSWSACSNNIQTRTYASSPSGCSGTPPADSIQRICNSVILTSVQIGNQIWTQKNLDVTTYRNGDVIPQVQDASTWSNLTTGAWCYYQNNTANGTIYGKLYNWYAVNDPRGLAPNGYHIPSDAEWTTLTNNLAATYIYQIGGTLKETGTSHWLSPNAYASNLSGFTGLPGSYRFVNGNFNSIGANGYWWSSSEYDSVDAWALNLSANNGNVNRSSYFKQDGFSVRCIKD